MGKSISKIIERLVLPFELGRYMVTNTDKIILVTHDYKYALKIAYAVILQENPKEYYLNSPNK